MATAGLLSQAVTTPTVGGNTIVRPGIPPPGGVSGSGSTSGPSGPTPTPPLQSLMAQNPGAQTFGPSTGGATPVGTAPVAAASNAGAQTAGAQQGVAQSATAQNATAQNATAAQAGPLADISSGSMKANDSTNAASQLNAITAANSPYIQEAEQQGLLSAASRGLENSSIGAGAAEAAAVQAAAPFAEQNANAATQGVLTNAQLAQQTALQNANLGTQVAEQNASLGTQVSEQNAGLGTQVSEQNAGLGTQVAEQNAQLGTTASLQNSQLATQAGEFNASQANANQQLNAQLATQQGQFNASQTQAAAATNAAANNAMTQQIMQLNESINQQYLSGTQAQTLASIQGQYNQLISQNSAAASLYTSMLNGINATMSNQNIAPQRVADTIAADQNLLSTGLGIIDALNGGTSGQTAANAGGAGAVNAWGGLIPGTTPGGFRPRP